MLVVSKEGFTGHGAAVRCSAQGCISEQSRSRHPFLICRSLLSDRPTVSSVSSTLQGCGSPSNPCSSPWSSEYHDMTLSLLIFPPHGPSRYSEESDKSELLRH